MILRFLRDRSGERERKYTRCRMTCINDFDQSEKWKGRQDLFSYSIISGLGDAINIVSIKNLIGIYITRS